MNIQESQRADNPVKLSRIGSGRHGGRPSQEQKQIQRSQHKSMPSPLIDDEPFLVLPRSRVLIFVSSVKFVRH